MGSELLIQIYKFYVNWSQIGSPGYAQSLQLINVSETVQISASKSYIRQSQLCSLSIYPSSS